MENSFTIPTIYTLSVRETVGASDTHNVIQYADREDLDIPRSINVEGHILEDHQGVVGGSVSDNINQVKGGI